MMTTDTKTKKVPRLRFPGFSGEWEDFEFKDLANLGKEKYNPITSTSSYKNIELESIASETGILKKVFDSKNQKSLKTKFQKGDVLYGKLRPYLKKYLRAPFDGVCTTEIWVLKGKLISNDLLIYIVQTAKFNEIVNIQSGSKMPRAEWSIVSASNFTLPKNKEEQEKIAGFLGVMDDRISGLRKKVELLRKYKKGIMQKIFNQEIRFKPARPVGQTGGDENGKDYPVWQEKKLGDIALIISGQSPNGNAYNTEGAGLPLYQGKADFGAMFTADPEVWTTETTKIAEPDDILISVRAPVGPTNFASQKMNIGRGLAAIRAWEGISQRYIFYFLRDIEPRVSSLGGGSTFGSITRKDLADIKIPCPSPDEQQKIADFLTSIDEKIDAEERELEQAKKFKKALLQQMFV